MSSEHTHPLQDFRCPFCGKPASIVQICGTGQTAVQHDVPVCATFRDLEAEEYLEACRKRRLN